IPLASIAASALPVLVVSGAHHAAFDAICDVLQERLRAERLVLPGYGHAPQLHPDFNDALAAFVERSATRGQTKRPSDSLLLGWVATPPPTPIRFRNEVAAVLRDTRAHTRSMSARRTSPRQAPRLDRRLAAAVPHLDDARQPIAETNRRVGELADAIGLPRPSYEQVRLLVRAARERKTRNRQALMLILDVQFRRRSPEALYELRTD